MKTESWRHVWRVGIAPQLSTSCLEAIFRGCDTNDRRLAQTGFVVTTQPKPKKGESLVTACGIGYGLWHSNNYRTEHEVERDYQHILNGCHTRTGDKWAHLEFVKWFDNCGRREMIAGLFHEVKRELTRRLRRGAIRGHKRQELLVRLNAARPDGEADVPLHDVCESDSGEMQQPGTGELGLNREAEKL